MQNGAAAAAQNGGSSKSSHPKGLKAGDGTDICTPIFTEALLTGQNCEAINEREK